MEDLTKQQIVLLTLLVSFVTSIATGIVAVSLMNQAPPKVSQTINRIVERTIEKVSSGESASADSSTPTVTFEDQTAEATDKVEQSMVRIRPRLGDASSVTGLGLIISQSGVIVTDKSAVAPLGDLVAVLPDGEEFPIQVIQSQINGDIVFALILIPQEEKANVVIMPVSFASSLKLGQSIFALSGKETTSLSLGTVTELPEVTGATSSVITSIGTTIQGSDVLLGSPLFTVTGDVAGIKTTSLEGNKGEENSAVFYPSNLLIPAIPTL